MIVLSAEMAPKRAPARIRTRTHLTRGAKTQAQSAHNRRMRNAARRACWTPFVLIERRSTLPLNDRINESEENLANLGYRLLTPDRADYEAFSRLRYFDRHYAHTIQRRRDRKLWFMFFSAWAWLFLLAIASQMALCHVSLPFLAVMSRLNRPRTTGVHVERSRGAVDDLLRDHDLLDALEAW